MKPLTRDAARAVDRQAQSRFRLPADLLMENAGAAVARFVLRQSQGESSPAALILCGPGNNGGDGFVAARHLLDRAATSCVSLVQVERLRGDALENAERFLALGGSITIEPESTFLERWLDDHPTGIVIDALFGIGLDRPLEGRATEWIAAVNRRRSRILAVDIPSGLDCDDGTIHGCAIRATWTLSFVARKVGFDRADGPRTCGEIHIAPIGFPVDRDPRAT